MLQLRLLMLQIKDSTWQKTHLAQPNKYVLNAFIVASRLIHDQTTEHQSPVQLTQNEPSQPGLGRLVATEPLNKRKECIPTRVHPSPVETLKSFKKQFGKRRGKGKEWELHSSNCLEGPSLTVNIILSTTPTFLSHWINYSSSLGLDNSI